MWWRHFSRRRHPNFVIDPTQLTASGYRGVRSGESLIVNGKSGIVSCTGQAGSHVEFAFRYPTDLAAFAVAVGAPVPAAMNMDHPWRAAAVQAVICGGAVTLIGIPLPDTGGVMLGPLLAIAVLVSQGRALAKPGTL